MKRLWLGLMLTMTFFPGFAQISPQSAMPFQPNINRGGRAVAVTVNPSNTNIAVVASESGGLFQTVNNGTTWFHLDSLPMFRMTDIKYAPASPPGTQILIASGWSDSRVINGGGIWRSTDGGMTWSKPATANPPVGAGCSTHANTWGIAFESGSTNVYVGTDCGLAVSRDFGATWTHTVPNPSDPRVRSVAAFEGQYAVDGTVTWTQTISTMCVGGLGRAPWVATNRSRDNVPAHFD